MTDTPARILVLARASLTSRTGAAIRLDLTVQSLSRLGSVDLVALTEAAPDPTPAWQLSEALPDVVTGRSANRIAFVRRRSRHRLARALAPHLPRQLRAADRRGEARAIAELVDRYDLVWCVTDRAFVSIPRGLRDTPTVLDLVDWEYDRRVEAARERRRGARRAAKVDRILARQLFSRWHQRALLVVSSAADSERSGLRNVHVLENSAPAATLATSDQEPTSRPFTVLFVGFLAYGPNAEAAAWLSDEIAPALRAVYPCAVVRVAGAGWNRPVGPIGPGVHYLGPIDSVGNELSAASVVCVPLRSGSGTRVKILEAWSHCVPVVATPKAVEGLAAEDGNTALVATTTAEIVKAIVRIANDRQLRDQLVANALHEYSRRYAPDVFQQRVAQLAAAASHRI